MSMGLVKMWQGSDHLHLSQLTSVTLEWASMENELYKSHCVNIMIVAWLHRRAINRSFNPSGIVPTHPYFWQYKIVIFKSFENIRKSTDQ